MGERTYGVANKAELAQLPLLPSLMFLQRTRHTFSCLDLAFLSSFPLCCRFFS